MPKTRRHNCLGSDASLLLQTLGGAALYRAAAPGSVVETVPLVGKQFALLAYLACVPRRTASRAALTNLFAPDGQANEKHAQGKKIEKRAGDAVRNVIQQLRSKLGQEAFGPLRSDPVHLALPIACDRDDLIAAWERRDFPEVVRAYGGDFLPRLETVAGPDFAHWIEHERAGLQRRFAQAAPQAITGALALMPNAEALERAIELARRFRDNSTFSQEAWQLLIRCLVARGEHDEARLETERLRALLALHDQEPESATRAILAMAKHGETSGAADRGTVTNGGESAGTKALFGTLVGRDTEVTAIFAAWDRARTGALVHVHIVAAAGLGKSRLLADVRQRLRARRASQGGARAVEVRASQSSRDIAYSFITDLARVLAERPGGLGVPDWAATELVALSPALSDAYKGAGRRQDATDSQEAHDIEHALGELIAVVALEGPLAIFLDDLHWSDPESLRLLAASLQYCGDLPVFIASASREECKILCTATRARRIELRPLDASSVEAALAHVAPLSARGWAERLPVALLQATHGSPLALVETLQLLTEKALLSATPNGWHTPDVDALFAALGEGDATRQRIEQLSPHERHLLLLLALSEAPLSSGRFRTAADQSASEFNSACTALERRGFISRQGDDWTIAHDEHAKAVRDTVDIAVANAAATAVGRAIATDAGNDLRELRRAGLLLARGGDAQALHDPFEQFVRVSRDRRDRRPVRALAREFLGGSADEHLLSACIRQFPMGGRARLLSKRQLGSAAAFAAVLFLTATLVLVRELRPASRPPDAILVAQLVTGELTPSEAYPVPVDANHWAGISVIDVRLSGRPWLRPKVITDGAEDLRPDHHGWTGGVAVPDSGVIDIFDLDLAGSRKRLTYARLDDLEPSWAPDNSRFVFSTSQWHQHGHYDLAIYDTLTRKVKQLTDTDDSDSDAHWSLDGSRIAFTRLYSGSGQYAICVIDTDGDHLRCRVPEVSAVLQVGAWIDAHHLAVRKHAGAVRELVRYDVEKGILDLPDQGGFNALISPDGRFAVCPCPRQGYPEGTSIVYPLERPSEFGVLRAVGTGSRRIDFAWAPTSPRAPFAARIAILLGQGPPQIGAAYQLRAAAADTAGRPVDLGVVRWKSQDTSIAMIDSTGRLAPRGVGRVIIDASAGGWRTTAAAITIGNPTPHVVLDETWSRGLDSEWTQFGVPRPMIVSSAALGQAFFNNGDGSFFSGAYTSRGFDTREGLWLEATLSTPITAPGSQEQVFAFQAMPDSARWAAWDHTTGDGPAGESAPHWWVRIPDGIGGTRFGEQFSITAPHVDRVLDAPAGIRQGRPYRVVMQIFPDGRCGVALDGKAMWVGAASFFEKSVHVMLAGNSVDTRILVGHLRVVTGIAPGIAWDSAESP